MVSLVGTDWNHIKRELMAMWQIVNAERELSPVSV